MPLQEHVPGWRLDPSALLERSSVRRIPRTICRIPVRPFHYVVKAGQLETNRMLAGKWLISDFKGEMFGSTFERHGTSGYDARNNKYIATLVHTISVGVDILEGSYDEKTKTLTLTSDSEAPDGKPMKMRRETQFNDDGTRTYSVYAQADGQKGFSEGMEVKYTKMRQADLLIGRNPLRTGSRDLTFGAAQTNG